MQKAGEERDSMFQYNFMERAVRQKSLIHLQYITQKDVNLEADAYSQLPDDGFVTREVMEGQRQIRISLVML